MPLLISLLLLLPGVADAKKDKGPPIDTSPGWFLTPPAGCGAGSAPFDPNMREIGKATADAQARSDLSRQIQTQVSNFVSTAYSSQTSTGGVTTASANAQSTSKVLTEQALLGARNVASAVTDGTLYLMVCIQPESLVSSFEEMAYLDDAMKSALSTGIQNTYGQQTQQLAALGL